MVKYLTFLLHDWTTSWEYWCQIFAPWNKIEKEKRMPYLFSVYLLQQKLIRAAISPGKCCWPSHIQDSSLENIPLWSSIRMSQPWNTSSSGTGFHYQPVECRAAPGQKLFSVFRLTCGKYAERFSVAFGVSDHLL